MVTSIIETSIIIILISSSPLLACDILPTLDSRFRLVLQCCLPRDLIAQYAKPRTPFFFIKTAHWYQTWFFTRVIRLGLHPSVFLPRREMFKSLPDR